MPFKQLQSWTTAELHMGLFTVHKNYSGMYNFNKQGLKRMLQ